MIFREMSSKIKTASQAAAEEARTATCSRIGSKARAPHKPEGRDPDHQDCDLLLDPIEEGSGMNPLWLTSIPPADLE